MKQKMSRTRKPRKPWYKTIRGQSIPPTRVENPEHGGKYDRQKWQKEAQKQKSSIGDLTLLELLYFYHGCAIMSTETYLRFFQISGPPVLFAGLPVSLLCLEDGTNPIKTI